MILGRYPLSMFSLAVPLTLSPLTLSLSRTWPETGRECMAWAGFDPSSGDGPKTRTSRPNQCFIFLLFTLTDPPPPKMAVKANQRPETQRFGLDERVGGTLILKPYKSVCTTAFNVCTRIALLSFSFVPQPRCCISTCSRSGGLASPGLGFTVQGSRFTAHGSRFTVHGSLRVGCVGAPAGLVPSPLKPFQLSTLNIDIPLSKP